jgi:hypothetical protein
MAKFRSSDPLGRRARARVSTTSAWNPAERRGVRRAWRQVRSARPGLIGRVGRAPGGRAAHRPAFGSAARAGDQAEGVRRTTPRPREPPTPRGLCRPDAPTGCRRRWACDSPSRASTTRCSQVSAKRGHHRVAPHSERQVVGRSLHNDYRGRASGVIQPEQRFGAGQSQMHRRIVRQHVVESAADEPYWPATAQVWHDNAAGQKLCSATRQQSNTQRRANGRSLPAQIRRQLLAGRVAETTLLDCGPVKSAA